MRSLKYRPAAVAALFLAFISIGMFYSVLPAHAAGEKNKLKTAGNEPTQSEIRAGATAANTPIRDKWALVVGISTFANPKVPKLTYAAKDAQDFYKYLVSEAKFSPSHVRLLLNEKATERRVMSELGNKFLARVAKPDDLVVLYFSTHGSPAQMDLRGRNYIVAYDSDPTDLYATGIDMQQIMESIHSRVLSDRVLLVLDACHSGGAADSKGLQRAANFDAQAIAVGSGQLVICSSQPEEQSWESARYHNGVFTKRLLEGLRSRGQTTKLREAFEHVKKTVAEEVKEDRPGARQTPVMSGKWNGDDLLLAVSPVQSQEVPASVIEELEPDSAQFPPAQPRTTAPSLPPTLGIDQPGQKKVVHVNLSMFPIEGEPKAWVSRYHKGLMSDPKETEYWFQKGVGLIHLGKHVEAYNVLSHAIEVDPNKSKYYLARALSLHLQGDDVSARNDIQSAYSVDITLKNVDFDFQK
ncbi:MAG TPA: caspase family protein [Candidatus Obscuribacterales bacterium]